MQQELDNADRTGGLKSGCPVAPILSGHAVLFSVYVYSVCVCVCEMFVAVVMQSVSVAKTDETEVEMSDVENSSDNILSSDGTYGIFTLHNI